MFKSIRTSEENKEIVSKLTRKLNLGSENLIGRIALAYSLSIEPDLSLESLKDSQGKQYSKDVLFGENLDFYLGLFALNYNLKTDHKDIFKYIKLHLDNGLTIISKEIENYSGHDFILKLVQLNIKYL